MPSSPEKQVERPTIDEAIQEFEWRIQDCRKHGIWGPVAYYNACLIFLRGEAVTWTKGDVPVPTGYESQLERATKALALLALGWQFDGDFDLDGLTADAPDVVGLLDTGRDITDEGFCHLNKAGISYVNEVLAELFTPDRHTSPSKVEVPDASH